MKIYTRTGDTGQSSLYRGGRVPKDHPRLVATGTLDELGSLLGLAVSHFPPRVSGLESLRTEFHCVQEDLFRVGAEVATAGDDPPAWQLNPESILGLEAAIDRMELDLEPLTNFILPGGHPAGASLHAARSVCRRAERAVLVVAREAPGPHLLQYLNRLSDYLFVAARWCNQHLGRPEKPLEI